MINYWTWKCLWNEVLVVRQSDNLGYWSLFTCRSRKAGLIRHPNLSHGQTTRLCWHLARIPYFSICYTKTSICEKSLYINGLNKSWNQMSTEPRQKERQRQIPNPDTGLWGKWWNPCDAPHRYRVRSFSTPFDSDPDNEQHSRKAATHMKAPLWKALRPGTERYIRPVA